MPLALDTIGIEARSWFERAAGARGISFNGTIYRLTSRNNLYVARWLLSSAIIWVLSLLYLLVTPSTFVSKMTMILPGSVSGSTVNLDTIGQSSTQPSAVFGSASISPKVIYKEIAESEQVLNRAAALLHMAPGRVPRPRIKLIDETSLMNFEVTGSSAVDAQRNAKALARAFDQQLEELRRDEMAQRSAIVNENLKLYRANLTGARKRILAFQKETGLLSINQFNDSAMSLELVNRKLADLRSEIQRLAAEQDALMSRLRLDAATAAVALKLAASPSFAKMTSDFGEANSLYKAESTRLGPNNPALIVLQKKRQAAMDLLIKAANSMDLDSSVSLADVVIAISGSQQGELLKAIVANDAAMEGRQKETRALETERKRVEDEVKRMSANAARLEDLKKSHLVAEAVYTSAVARLDTNKSDIYAAYPMVQMLSAPDLPGGRSQPKLMYSIMAGIIGTLFMALGWGMLWARRLFALKHRKKR